MPAYPTNVPDILFSSDNPEGIPTLLLSQQSPCVLPPIAKWGEVSRRSRGTQCWHFFTDDYKFNGVWKNPLAVSNTRAAQACEVNYSTYDHMPKAMAVYSIYQKRWLARYWQHRGMQILVDLNVAPTWETINLLGVPEGWRAYATRAADRELEALEHQHRLACERAGTDELVMLVYAGGKHVRAFCEEHNLVHVEDKRNAERRKKRKSGPQIFEVN